MTVDEVAQNLLFLHSRLFSNENLMFSFQQANLSLKGEREHAIALSEWRVFGLYAIVGGIRAAWHRQPAVGQLIAQTLYAELYSGLREQGVPPHVLPQIEKDMRERFDEYEKIAQSARPEKLGRLAAEKMLDQPALRTLDAFALGIAANEAYLAALKAVDKLFANYRVKV